MENGKKIKKVSNRDLALTEIVNRRKYMDFFELLTPFEKFLYIVLSAVGIGTLLFVIVRMIMSEITVKSYDIGIIELVLVVLGITSGSYAQKLIRVATYRLPKSKVTGFVNLQIKEIDKTANQFVIISRKMIIGIIISIVILIIFIVVIMVLMNKFPATEQGLL